MFLIRVADTKIPKYTSHNTIQSKNKSCLFVHMFISYFLFGAPVHWLSRGGTQLGGVACHCSLLLIGCLGGGQVLTDLLPLSLLDVIPGGILQVSLHLRAKSEDLKDLKCCKR